MKAKTIFFMTHLTGVFLQEGMSSEESQVSFALQYPSFSMSQAFSTAEKIKVVQHNLLKIYMPMQEME